MGEYIPGLSPYGCHRHPHVVGADFDIEGEQDLQWTILWQEILDSDWAIWDDLGHGVGVVVPLETAAEVIAGSHCPQGPGTNVVSGPLLPMVGYAVHSITQLNRLAYQIGFILSSCRLPQSQDLVRYIELTTERDMGWKRRHAKLRRPSDMLDCVRSGGSWGSNFSWRRRRYRIEEADARQLAVVSRFGLCCPEGQDLHAPLPMETGEGFRPQHLHLALEIRVGFLLPGMHAAMRLPHATALVPPDMSQGYGTLLMGQARAQAALREAFAAQFL